MVAGAIQREQGTVCGCNAAACPRHLRAAGTSCLFSSCLLSAFEAENCSGDSRPKVPLRLPGQLTRCNSGETSKSAEPPTGSSDSSLHGSRPSHSQCILAVWPQGWCKAARGGLGGGVLHTHRAARHEGTEQKSPQGWSSVRHTQLCYLQWVGPPSGLSPPLTSRSEPMVSKMRLPRLQSRFFQAGWQPQASVELRRGRVGHTTLG